MARLTIQDMLAEARSHLVRLRPAEAAAAVREGALLVDTRSQDHRLREGTVPGSVNLPLSVLEWCADPDSCYQDSSIQSFDDHIVLICHEGYSSSLAARRLVALFHDADLDQVHHRPPSSDGSESGNRSL